MGDPMPPLRAYFVVNPRAGPRRSRAIEAGRRVREAALAAGIEATVAETSERGHARELAAEAARRGYEVVAAAGGDGTINEVACGLLGSESALAILALG